MALSKTLVSSLFLILVMLANKVHSVEDVTSFTYDTFSSTSKDLTYQGDAFVPSGSSFVRLTKTDATGNALAFSVGRVVYSPPVAFWEPGRQADFETTLRFSISPNKGDQSPADGLTFFIIPVDEPIPTSSTGGSFGLFDLSTGVAPSVFAVEFDIFYESDNTWDPRYRHIGIDINSRVSKNATRFDYPLSELVTARINYVSNTRTITVVATYPSGSSFLSYVFDLKTILPQQVQVGISAATGGSVAIHDLHSWYFSSTLIWDGSSSNNNEKAYLKEYV